MSYLAILRELKVRLDHHTKGELLAGLKIKKAGDWRVDGQVDLPQLTLIDIAATDLRGTSNGTISMFLTVSKDHDWLKETDDAPNGLIDWAECIMDAIDTKPSDGNPDSLLIAHNPDGTPKLDGHGKERELLREASRFEMRMAEIREGSYTLQLDFVFSAVTAKRARRRSTPFPKATV
jgi:hypothetical protein